MAPAKLPKKALKPIDKPMEKPISKKMKKKRNYHNFDIYIYKLLKSVTPEHMRISRRCMMVMNNAVSDLLERFAMEAGRLVAHGKRTTLGSREVQSAVKLLLPGELAKHANMEGMKAVTLYHNSMTKTPNKS